MRTGGFRYTARGSQQSGFPLLHVERSSAPQTAARHSLQDIAPYAPYVLSILRIVVALLFLEHGLSRLFGFPSPLPTPALFSLYWFAGAIELVGGALLLFGLFTRTAAFIMSGQMAFAYFLSHAPAGFFPILNRGDGAILFCFVFLYIAFAGAGPWSLDALWRRKR
jgi:Predicted membrane protein